MEPATLQRSVRAIVGPMEAAVNELEGHPGDYSEFTEQRYTHYAHRARDTTGD